jgi:predicted ABC-type ATPase
VPILTIIAGPNGSGKSTITRTLVMPGRENLLDPDAIARRINPSLARASPLKRLSAATRRFGPCVKRKLAASTLRFVYVCLSTPEQNIRRVQNRVSKGGHDVPEDDIRRRYSRSAAHVPECIRIADDAALYDNSGFEATLVLEAHNGAITWRAEQLPAWGEEILRAFEPE